MRFIQHSSGSTGNLYTVEFQCGKRLMLECGMPWNKVQEKLSYNLTDIAACFCSHEHLDHSKAVKDVMTASIDVYSGKFTFEALELLDNRRAKVIADKTLVRFDDFEVLAFRTNHDAAEPFGFCVREKTTNEYLLFATDTSHITQKFNVAFDIIAIECSYDRETLQQRVNDGDIHETVAKRLLTSHQDKNTAKAYLKEHADLSKCRELHLLHLSGDNIDKEETQKEFENMFWIDTNIREDYEVQRTNRK